MGDLFQPGDVVTLKSGGPCMTVISVASGLVSVVYWRDRDQDFKTTGVIGTKILKLLISRAFCSKSLDPSKTKKPLD